MRSASRSKLRVLVVDDEPQVLVALEDLLSDDYSVLKTTSAQNALELLGQEPDIAVVLTDQRMPKMSGDELLEAMEGASDAKRILVTGFADLAAIVRAVNEGHLFAYVTKPWDPDDLRGKVQSAAEQFEQGRRALTDRQLLHDLLNHSPDGIFFKDRELRFVEANQAFRRMLGIDPGTDLAGRRLGELLRDDLLNRDVELEERRVLRDGAASCDSIRRYIPGAEEPAWLEETRAPVRSIDGSIVGLVGITRDVTERFRTQAALAESEDLHRKQTDMLNAILHGLAEGVVVTDQAGNFLLCNPQAERLLGVDANALSVSTWARVCQLYELDNKTALSSENNPLEQAIRGRELSETEICIRRSDELLRVAITATPLRDQAGTVIGGIGLLRDISEKRSMELRLAQAQKMDAIGRLAGGVAHDFNNLLSVIQSCAELILRGLSTEDAKRIEVGHILNAAQRAALLTRQLLSFSRQQVVQPRVLQINDVVRGIEVMLRRVIGEHIEVVTSLDDDLGLVRIDASQLEQIVMNLAVNARDAMPEGGQLRIETRNWANLDGEDGEEERPRGDFVVLTIGDTGTGMSAETQRRMFEPFFTTKDVGKGSGLGLSTVYGIVEQSGGFIRCQSAPNSGARFEIYLHRSYSSDSGVVPTKVLTDTRPHGDGLILLVEDEDSVRRVAAAILRNHGYDVLEARRPSDALNISKVCEEPIDLLLTDVVMPESSGPQLAAQLVARHPGMAVMYMSGYSGDTALMGKALRDGVTFLQKPFTPALLTEAVSDALPKRSLRPRARSAH